VSEDPSTWGWAPYPVEPGNENPARTEVGDDGAVLDAESAGRVVGLGALCGLRASDIDAQSQSFWVSEFARLDNGRRVILHEDRGFTTSAPRGAGAGRPVRDGMTREDIVETVLAVVLPDPDDGEDHPWAWLARLAQRRGLDVTAEDLRGLPYEVVLTDDLTHWLGG
jgi:hypothetical protein